MLSDMRLQMMSMDGSLRKLADGQIILEEWKPEIDGKVSELQGSVADLKRKVDLVLNQKSKETRHRCWDAVFHPSGRPLGVRAITPPLFTRSPGPGYRSGDSGARSGQRCDSISGIHSSPPSLLFPE